MEEPKEGLISCYLKQPGVYLMIWKGNDLELRIMLCKFQMLSNTWRKSEASKWMGQQKISSSWFDWNRLVFPSLVWKKSPVANQKPREAQDQTNPRWWLQFCVHMFILFWLRSSPNVTHMFFKQASLVIAPPALFFLGFAPTSLKRRSWTCMHDTPLDVEDWRN